MICHLCKGEVVIKDRIARTAECPTCNADVHCCLNCVNYDTSAHNRCRESQAEWVSDRERANFVDNSVKVEATLRFINHDVRMMLDAIKGQ